jgi:uncharacterized membrane-anchored protein
VNVGLGPAVTDALTIAVLGVALVIQFRTRRYTPRIYWLCVVLVSTVFVVWYRQERTLAITSIDTPRRDAILTTFALGIAAGDLATEALSLGFRSHREVLARPRPARTISGPAAHAA